MLCALLASEVAAEWQWKTPKSAKKVTKSKLGTATLGTRAPLARPFRPASVCRTSFGGCFANTRLVLIPSVLQCKCPNQAKEHWPPHVHAEDHHTTMHHSTSCFRIATGIPDNDLSEGPAASVEECQGQCLATSACKFFTYEDVGNLCKLKTSVRPREASCTLCVAPFTFV